MLKKDHHKRILTLLNKMDAAVLLKNHCYFGGGTAIALQLNEFRLSVDVDLICDSAEGYRAIRGMVETNSLGQIFKKDIELAREVRKDQYGIRTAILIDGVPIKFEIVREDRISLSNPEFVDGIPVPLVSKYDLFTLKLLANDDRGLDVSNSSRDLIDLAVMKSAWGDIPKGVWEKVEDVYGNKIHSHYDKCRALLADDHYLSKCLKEMEMHPDWGSVILQELDIHSIRAAKMAKERLDHDDSSPSYSP
jgi:hypothetical protein